jgi:hypothetical protein
VHRTWLAFIPFFVVALSIAVGFHLFLYRRLVRGMTANRGARLAGGVLFSLLGALVVAGPLSSRALPGNVLGQASYLWWALSFYLFTLLLAVDLGGFVLRLASRVRRARAGGAAPAPAASTPPPPPPSSPESPARRELLLKAARASAAVGALGVTGYGFEEAWGPPRITEVPVRLARLPAALSGLTLAHLTDIHVGAWIDRRFVEELVGRTNALEPDAVLITGTSSTAASRTCARWSPRSRACAPASAPTSSPATRVLPGVDEWCAELEAMGMTVLRNRRVAQASAGASLDLVASTTTGQRPRPARLRPEGRPRRARPLARRRPARAPAPGSRSRAGGRGGDRPAAVRAHARRADLALELRGAPGLPVLQGPLQVDGMSLYVSNGCGLWGPPVRVGAPPEIVKVVLG